MTERVRIPELKIEPWIPPTSLTNGEQETLIAHLKEKFHTDGSSTTRLAIQKMLDTHGINASVVLLPPHVTVEAAVNLYNLLSFEAISISTVDDFAALDPEVKIVSKNPAYQGRMGPKTAITYQEMIGNAQKVINTRNVNQE